MIYIKGIVYLEVMIGGKAIDQALNLFNDIILTESVAALVPSAKLTLNDHADVLRKKFAFSDGNAFSIVMGKDPADVRTTERKYVLFSVSPANLSGYNAHSTVLAYANLPKYITKSSRRAYKGTSEDVLREIAEENELEFSGPSDADSGSAGASLDDSQTWINSCKSSALFAQHEVARHGYINDKSGMVMVVTSLNELRYRNIIDVAMTAPDKIDHYFLHNASYSGEESSKIIYAVREARYKSDAGLMNNYINYGAIRTGPNLEGEHDVYDKIDVTVGDSDFLVINKNISSAVDSVARIDYSNLDCGNTHRNYYKAVHQNVRILAMFTERISLITYDPTAVGLLDPVIFKQTDVSNLEPAKETDVYVVLGKTIMVHNGQNYVERIELGRMTVKEPGSTSLAGAIAKALGLTEDDMAQQVPHGLPQSNYNTQSPSYSNNLDKATALGSRVQAVSDTASTARATVPQAQRVNNVLPSVAAIGTALQGVDSAKGIPLSSKQTAAGTNTTGGTSGTLATASNRRAQMRRSDTSSPGGSGPTSSWTNSPILIPWDGVQHWTDWNDDRESYIADGLPIALSTGDTGSLAVALYQGNSVLKALNNEIVTFSVNLTNTAQGFEEAYNDVMVTSTTSGASTNVYAPQYVSSQHQAVMNMMFNTPGGPVDTVIGPTLPTVSILSIISRMYCTALAQLPPEFVKINEAGGPQIPLFKLAPLTVIAEVERTATHYRAVLLALVRIWNVLVSSSYRQTPVYDEVNWKFLLSVIDQSTDTSGGMPKSIPTVSANFRAESAKLNDRSRPRWIPLAVPALNVNEIDSSLTATLIARLRAAQRQSFDSDHYVVKT